MLKTHLFSRYYFTDCFAECEQRTLYGALVQGLYSDPSHVTEPYQANSAYHTSGSVNK